MVVQIHFSSRLQQLYSQTKYRENLQSNVFMLMIEMYGAEGCGCFSVVDPQIKHGPLETLHCVFFSCHISGTLLSSSALNSLTINFGKTNHSTKDF